MFNQRWKFAALLAIFTTSCHCKQVVQCNQTAAQLHQ